MKIIELIIQIMCMMCAVICIFMGLCIGFSKGEPNYAEACFYLLIAVINYGTISIIQTSNNDNINKLN